MHIGKRPLLDGHGPFRTGSKQNSETSLFCFLGSGKELVSIHRNARKRQRRRTRTTPTGASKQTDKVAMQVNCTKIQASTARNSNWSKPPARGRNPRTGSREQAPTTQSDQIRTDKGHFSNESRLRTPHCMCQERAKIAHSEAKQRKAGHGEDVGSARSTDHRVLVVEEGGVLPELPLDAREVAGAHEAVDGLGLGRPRSPVLATWHRHLLVPPPSLPSRSLLSERVWARSSGCVLCGEEPSRRGRTGGPSGTNPSDVPCPPKILLSPFFILVLF
jgi:hypothetical protein